MCVTMYGEEIGSQSDYQSPLRSTETLVFIECAGLGTIYLSSIINVQQEERNVECERKVLLLFSCLFISYVETTCNKKNTLP